MPKKTRGPIGGTFPVSTTTRVADSLPTAVTASLSNTQAESGKQSTSGDARFSVRVGKGR